MTSPKVENLLLKELKRIESMELTGIQMFEWSNYILGINVNSAKRSNCPCGILNFLAVFMAVYVIVGLVCYIIANFYRSFTVYSEAMILSLQLTIGVIKILYLRCHSAELNDLMRLADSGAVLHGLEIFELDIPNKVYLSTEIGQILLDTWHNLNRQVTAFFFTVCLPVSWYIVRPYFQYIYDCFIQQSDTCELSLTYPAIVPHLTFGHHEYPSYILRYYLLQMGPILCGLPVYTVNSFFIITTVHEVGLIRVLRFLVCNSTNAVLVPKHLRFAYLASCVKLYVRIVRYHARIEAFFKYIILVQCGVSCLLICLLLYKLSMGLNLEYAVLGMIMTYLTAILFEISLYNFNAQRVETESELLTHDWYNCEWYDESSQFKFIIQMLIMFDNHSFGLSVGGFTKMSLKLLLLVFRLSGNFFLLLRNVNANA